MTTPSAALCLTEGGAKVHLLCVFPFTYTSVTEVGKKWVDYWGRHVTGNWGDCDTVSFKVEVLWG